MVTIGPNFSTLRVRRAAARRADRHRGVNHEPGEPGERKGAI